MFFDPLTDSAQDALLLEPRKGLFSCPQLGLIAAPT